ncbi:TetR/AcrR family transcriptional regulator [Pedobacter gandavensis]|uniref:TetR/AcrR family transcriptional regulator n=1 Tax=Pedobacter gandavensis TaxID=2679963 RepID=UPI0029300286|nr:TetR/AcrR family transcriptional regulator [Pedobacter gandavensis]
MTLNYKNVSGHVKNKNETMQRLVDAVGSIIKKKGYKGLGLNVVAKEAEVSKVLIYRYFGGLDQLVEAYVLKNDYWIAKAGEVKIETEGKTDRESLKELVVNLLKGHYEYFNTHEEMRSIILWEVTEKNNILNSVCQLREEVGSLLIEKAEPLFAGSKKSIKAITAILVSGIYYMILHAKKNESTICGIDVNSKDGEQEIMESIEQIVDWAFAV